MIEPTEEIYLQIQDLKAGIQELKDHIKELRTMQEVQQESITSLIALSQQQTTVIEQQTSVILQLVSR